MGLFLFILVVFGAALIILGVTVAQGLAGILCLVFGLMVLLLTVAAIAYTKLYRKTLANEAFVKTGYGGAQVVLDGGMLVIPVIHRTVPVSLETMKLEVERHGPDALISQDNLRVDIKAEFYLKVQANREDILDAARSLGEKSINAASVGGLVFEKLVSALRSVAATKSLVELHTKRNEFAEAVHEMVRGDLKANGLTLESVTVSRLDQTDTNLLNDNNVFDAQGKKRIADVTQEARVERNRIEREAERQIKHKDVETRKQILELEKDRQTAEANQAMEVANVHAEAKRKAEAFQLAQDQAVTERDIDKNRAVQTAEVKREQDVEASKVDKEVILIAKAKEKETADIERAKVVETTEREKQIAIAHKEAERAAAQAAALQQEAGRERAAQDVITVQVTAEADREAAKKLIAAKQVIEQDKIKEQTEADVLAYQAVKNAQGEREAADLRYEATLKLAQADSEAAKVRAQGDTAEKMVDVNVEAERVKVEEQRVEVERQSLQNRQDFSEAALEFEVQKLRIQADKETRVALAKAIGEFMSRGNYTIFGDPTTLAAMTEQYSKGMGLATKIEGFLEKVPQEVRGAAESAAAGLGSAIESAVKNLGAKKTPGKGDGETETPGPEGPQEDATEE